MDYHSACAALRSTFTVVALIVVVTCGWMDGWMDVAV